jgi:DNA-binding transcriptional regulator of glucitol operon
VVRSLLAPRWLVVHLVALIAMLACFRLGWWQWDRSQSSTGSPQNVGYALQWPLFGLFVPFMYWRMYKLDQRKRAAAAERPAEPPATTAQTPAPDVKRRSPTEWRDAAARQEPGDRVLAEYNSYLAALNARDAEHEERSVSR